MGTTVGLFSRTAILTAAREGVKIPEGPLAPEFVKTLLTPFPVTDNDGRLGEEKHRETTVAFSRTQMRGVRPVPNHPNVHPRDPASPSSFNQAEPQKKLLLPRARRSVKMGFGRIKEDKAFPQTVNRRVIVTATVIGTSSG